MKNLYVEHKICYPQNYICCLGWSDKPQTGFGKTYSERNGAATIIF